MSEEYSIKLGKYETKDVHDNHINGSLTVIWRDWDEIIKNHPKMIYVSSVDSGEIKGPHIHTRRESYFICIHGKVVFVVKKSDGTYDEIISSDENPVMVHVPKNVSSAHMNLSSSTSRILALADIAWKPNDNEMKNDQFDDYNWKKWENIS
jgi:dTDP-4-dehydrorhamnose 3,5-epimerase